MSEDDKVEYHEALDDFVCHLSNDLEMKYSVYWCVVCHEYREEELILDITGCLDSYV